MKIKFLDKTGKEKGNIELPKNFSSKIRKDIMLKVVEAQKDQQPYGSKIGAGAGYSASGILKHRRHVWKTTYGKGIARTPRKIMSRHGSSFNWIGATVSNTRGGRKSHPPKAEKNYLGKINKKELLLAINSALSGSVDKKIISERYNVKSDFSGVVFEDSILTLKTKDFIKVLEKILGELSDKALKKKKIRAGKGKTRGRKYKSNAGLLFVVGSNEKMNRKGISVVKVNELMVNDLAPNAIPGRLTCYTEKAIKEIGEKIK